jgi:hypothetical protein
MPWIIGIDEAGYGPNLGPFVMTAVACRVPAELADADLWRVLRSAVRRHPTAPDGRILVDDSKLVYSTARGLAELEMSVIAALSGLLQGFKSRHYLESLCPDVLAILEREPWFHGNTLLPVRATVEEYAPAVERFAAACEHGQIQWGHARSIILCPADFNRLLDHWGSKGAVLGHGLGQLLRAGLRLEGPAEPLSFFIDKHGGRNTYAALLQDAIPEGMVLAEEEGMARSAYRVVGLERDVRLTFQPRADAEHFCVALASMASKYLREVLMLEFNEFWQAHVPGLKPTAGYPGDAARFFEAIRPVALRLGIPPELLWRRK